MRLIMNGNTSHFHDYAASAQALEWLKKFYLY
jgi:hypothetical protein